MYADGNSTPASQIGRRRSFGALRSAILYLRGGVRTDGTGGDDEWDIAGSEWRRISHWAAAEGLTLPASSAPERPGGREHDVRFDPESNRWLKFTKPCCAGYTVHLLELELTMLPATPLEYLERWNTHNRIFGDTVELMGFQDTNQGPRLVISQPHVPGEPASWDELEETFVSKSRMKKLSIPKLLGGYDSRAYFKGRIGIFDVRPLNCFRHAVTHEVAAIDVIPRMFTRAEANQLEKMTLS